MSLLPSQILPPTTPIGTTTPDGKVFVEQNWYLLFYNLCEQVLANGSGVISTTLINTALMQAKGPDTERQIANLFTLIASMPNTAGRIAALESKVANLEKLLAQSLKVWN